MADCMDGTVGNFGDYEYIHYALEDYPEARKHLMEKLDGVRIRIKLHEHKRFLAQQMLLEGSSPMQIASELDMKLKTVQTIKYRMQKAILKEET